MFAAMAEKTEEQPAIQQINLGISKANAHPIKYLAHGKR